jgi:hypothetical protein
VREDERGWRRATIAGSAAQEVYVAKKTPSLPREADRKKLPVAVRHQLLMEAGYMCGNPACRNVITLDLHHIEYVSAGGGDEPSNLLVLCPYHHEMHHAGQIPVEAIRMWKGLLVALNQAFSKESMDLLLFLHQRADSPHWYTADGVLRFAGLFAAGLVEFGDQICEETFSNFIESRHEVRLSDKGRQLVEAWRAGDESKYTALLSASSG